MNQVEFQTFLSAIESLEASTAIQVSTPWGTATLDRRCSPYVSHQSVAYVEKATDLVVISNRRHAIAALGHGDVNMASVAVPLEAECDLKWVELQVPKTLLEHLLGLVAKLFGYQLASHIVAGTLIVKVWLALPILEGFEPDPDRPGHMRPVFRGRPVRELDEAAGTEEVSYTAKFGGAEEKS